MSHAMARWWYEIPRGEAGEIWCYTDRISYAAGDEVVFYVHTTARRYSVTILRDGAEQEVVLQRSGLRGREQQTRDDCYERGCGWVESFRLSVPAEWRSGGYLAFLTVEDEARAARYEHWFAVRPARAEPQAVLLVAATSTWIAYNAWGGANHYEGIHGADRGSMSPRLSTERPWGRGLAWLPPGAPRHPYETDLPIGGAVRYGAKEAAYATGLPKYTASAGWAMFEHHFVKWAETRGHQVDVVTQHDLHFTPEVLRGYRCVAIVGHDEYWSWEMRDHIDAYVEDGGSVARFGGNFLWQVRLEEEGRQQVCFKYADKHHDPAFAEGARRHLTTSCWDDPVTGRPGARSLGVTASRGGYVRCYGAAVRASGGYTVYRPEHWVFEGCDLYFGDLLGARARVVAHEVDGLAYTMRAGRPYATGDDGIDPDRVEILAMSPATFSEEDHGNAGSVLFIGDEDARFIAEVLEGEATPEAVGRIRYGAGMLVAYSRGSGGVVNAGSVEWVNGLRLREPFVEQCTDTVLRQLLDGGWPQPATGRPR
jgi:hypothetical protein